MSSQPPPTYEFTGIDYNPQYYNTTSSSGITESQANNLYLRKTVIDSATAVETFTAGIKTNNIETINGNTLTITGQSSFISAPNCDDVPVDHNDLCNKAYVDGKISAGGANFFYLNNDQLSNSGVPFTNQLGTGIAITATQQVNTSGRYTAAIQVGAFVTDSNVPYITTIPAGIWTLSQWGKSNVGVTGSLRYFFTVCRYRPSTANTLILGQSGYSSEIKISSEPELYFASLTLAAQTITLEDRILIKVYAESVGDTGTFSSYWQKDYYSYITTPLLQASNHILYGGLIAATTSITGSIYAHKQSFQLPVGTYFFSFAFQYKYTGTFPSFYNAIYSGATQYAVTTQIFPSYYGWTNLISTGQLYIGSSGTALVTVTTANLWYSIGLTYGGGTFATSEVLGQFNALKIG